MLVIVELPPEPCGRGCRSETIDLDQTALSFASQRARPRGSRSPRTPTTRAFRRPGPRGKVCRLVVQDRVASAGEQGTLLPSSASAFCLFHAPVSLFPAAHSLPSFIDTTYSSLFTLCPPGRQSLSCHLAKRLRCSYGAADALGGAWLEALQGKLFTLHSSPFTLHPSPFTLYATPTPHHPSTPPLPPYSGH
ncbi:hypothetical protein XM38_007370 [Halomicronema hongdechloris C2206]|uniref:Uncharacterized protein n=1 Tax=Halomicronema hongdechloris C2206 TaxID=1641165 RepID=A0A1Z3HHR2_9CYAN|nr:hypothetical protein XM38_007370 [Halomicronema hongdechloris C2206]